MESANKKILITGATGTVGFGLALTLAEKGVQIAIHCNNSVDKAKLLKKEIEKKGGRAFIFQSDLRKFDNVKEMVTEVLKALGGINIFINTASFFERTPLGSVTEENWDTIIDTDLKAAFFVSQAVGIEMQRSGGKIILFSDVAGQRPYAGYLPYCIAKAGTDCLVKGLAKSLAPKVQVNAIAPYIITRPKDITDKGWDDLLNKMPSGKPTSIEEIYLLVKMILESKASLTGQIIAIDGGRLTR